MAPKDVFYFDLDTFFLQDPVASFLHAKQEMIFSSNGDGDCVNIGLFYIRSTLRTTLWFSQFLEWLLVTCKRLRRPPIVECSRRILYE